MIENKPSRTARAVSLARALSVDNAGAALDPFAARFLPGGVESVASFLHSAKTPSFARAIGAFAASVLTGGLVDHITLRTQAIDRETEAASIRGIHQFVILGAGFDMRAWRLGQLAGARSYEIDHPATQQEKRTHLGALEQRSVFVPVDFEKGGFSDALLAAGFNPTQPSTWIWEGVVPYLNRAAVEATLGGISALAAKKSTLVLSYVEPLRAFGPLQGVIQRGFSLLGEPLRFFQTPADMARQLAAFGFSVERDSNSSSWASAKQQNLALRARALSAERIVVAAR